jgi:hypothetical protein
MSFVQHEAECSITTDNKIKLNGGGPLLKKAFGLVFANGSLQQKIALFKRGLKV